MPKSSAVRPPTGSSLPRSTEKKTHTLLGLRRAELTILTLTPPQAAAESERTAAAPRRRRFVRFTPPSRRTSARDVNRAPDLPEAQLTFPDIGRVMIRCPPMVRILL